MYGKTTFVVAVLVVVSTMCWLAMADPAPWGFLGWYAVAVTSLIATFFVWALLMVCYVFLDIAWEAMEKLFTDLQKREIR